VSPDRPELAQRLQAKVAKEGRSVLESAGVPWAGEMLEEIELLDVVHLLRTAGGGFALPPGSLKYKEARTAVVGRMLTTAAYAALPPAKKSEALLGSVLDYYVENAKEQRADSVKMRLTTSGAGPPRSVGFATGSAPPAGELDEGAATTPPEKTTRATPVEARTAVTDVVEAQIKVLPPPGDMPKDEDIRAMKEAVEAPRPKLPSLTDLELPGDNRVRPHQAVRAGARREFHHDRAVSVDAELDLLGSALSVVKWGGAVRASEHFTLHASDSNSGVRFGSEIGTERNTPLVAIYTVVGDCLEGFRKEVRDARLDRYEAASFVDAVWAELDRLMYNEKKTLTICLSETRNAGLAHRQIGARYQVPAPRRGGRGRADDGYDSYDDSYTDARTDHRQPRARARRPRGREETRRDRSRGRDDDRRSQGRSRSRDRGDDRRGGRDTGGQPYGGKAICFDWADKQVDSKNRGCQFRGDCKFRHEWLAGERRDYRPQGGGGKNGRDRDRSRGRSRN